MAFMRDKQELKPGLVIFRRTDVEHNEWYCRIKIPKVDRYKTISLGTADVDKARTEAIEKEFEMRIKIKNDVPVFDKRFSAVSKEYLDLQQQRQSAGDITKQRLATGRSRATPRPSREHLRGRSKTQFTSSSRLPNTTAASERAVSSPRRSSLKTGASSSFSPA